MKIIKLTRNTGGSVYINIDHIGDFYEVPKEEYGKIISPFAYTNVGVTTHNNGGFKVKERAENILLKINKLK
jgi:hypothetical protein